MKYPQQYSYVDYKIWKYSLLLHWDLKNAVGPLVHFLFWQPTDSKKQLDTSCVSNIICQKDLTTVCILHVNAVLSYSFSVNSLRNIIKSTAQANFQSCKMFHNSGWGQFFLFRKNSILVLHPKKKKNPHKLLSHWTAVNREKAGHWVATYDKTPQTDKNE